MNRRWGLVGSLVVIAGVAAGLALALRSSPGPGVPRPLGAPVSVGRLSLPVPRGFHSYPMPVGLGPGSPVASHVVTNFRVPVHATIEGVLSRWSAATEKFMAVKRHDYGPPANEVALELEQSSGPGCIGPCPPPSVRLHLPLSPSQPWDQEHPASGAPGYRSGYFRVHHAVYYVLYWIGPDAPANDREAVLRALGSIRPNH